MEEWSYRLENLGRILILTAIGIFLVATAYYLLFVWL